MPGPLEVLALILAAGAAISDGARGRIPNGMTYPAIVIGLVAGSPIGAILAAAPAFWLFRRGKIGGGDVKLFLALGGLLGARAGIEVEAIAIGLAVGLGARRVGPWALAALVMLA